MTAEDLKRRTAAFALRIVKFCGRLPQTWEARRIGGQLFDSGTSVGANCRAACRGRSRAEFISKIGVVVEEADETEFWLMLLKTAGITDDKELGALLQECREILAIFSSSQKTAKANLAATRTV